MELAQQAEQAEVLVGTRLALEVDLRDITDRAETCDAREQFWGCSKVEAPAGTTAAEPGPQ